MKERLKYIGLAIGALELFAVVMGILFKFSYESAYYGYTFWGVVKGINHFYFFMAAIVLTGVALFFCGSKIFGEKK